MIEKHLPMIKQYLNVDDLDIQETPFGYAVIKGNWYPSQGIDGITVAGLSLDIRDRVLHERVLVINREIGIRSHEEEDQENEQRIS